MHMHESRMSNELDICAMIRLSDSDLTEKHYRDGLKADEPTLFANTCYLISLVRWILQA